MNQIWDRKILLPVSIELISKKRFSPFDLGILTAWYLRNTRKTENPVTSSF
jgi:hypothetical protein